MFELEAYAQETLETTQIPNGANGTDGADGIQPAPPDAFGGSYQYFMMMGLIFVIFYFLLIRPEKKKREDQENQINSLKRNDKIITAGGIHGSIVSMKDHTAVIKIAENTNIEILKTAISTVVEKKTKK